MRQSNGIVSTLMGTLLLMQAHAAYSLEVIESAFCVKLDAPDCAIYIPEKSRITLHQLQEVQEGEPRIFYWSKINLREDKKFMHVWITEDRETSEWLAKVHVSWADKLRNRFNEVAPQVSNLAMQALSTIYQDENPSAHNVQGIILSALPSGSYRTHSSLKAAPGTYKVEIRTLDGEVIPGGEAKTIKVTAGKPPRVMEKEGQESVPDMPE